jgi:hypothetical protein
MGDDWRKELSQLPDIIPDVIEPDDQCQEEGCSDT